jgi:6,7-dimethyl-8-ribityllumazine synthase
MRLALVERPRQAVLFGDEVVVEEEAGAIADGNCIAAAGEHRCEQQQETSHGAGDRSHIFSEYRRCYIGYYTGPVKTLIAARQSAGYAVGSMAKSTPAADRMTKLAPAPLRTGAGDIPLDAKVAIVAARFNERFVEELLEGCTRTLNARGVDSSRVTIHRVPGAFELPVAAQAVARTKHFAAIVCLGCVIRGETPHFDYVAGECARGIARVSLDESIPVIFGVLTTNDEQQALDRIGGKHGHAGERAAEAALEMIALLHRVRM